MPILSTLRNGIRRHFGRKKSPPRTEENFKIEEKKEEEEEEEGFPLFKLPQLVLQILLPLLDFIELIQISRCSKRARNSVKWAIQPKSIGKNYTILFDFTTTSYLHIDITWNSQKFYILHVGPEISRIFGKCPALYVETRTELIEASNLVLELSKVFYAVHCQIKNYSENLELFVECVKNYQNTEEVPPVLTYQKGEENLPLDFIIKVSEPISLLQIMHKTRKEWIQFDLKNDDVKRTLFINSHSMPFVVYPMMYDLWSSNCHTINISHSLSTLEFITFHLLHWNPLSETVNIIAVYGERDFTSLFPKIPVTFNTEEFTHPIYGIVKESYQMKQRDHSKKAFIFTRGNGPDRILIVYIPSEVC